MFNGSTEHLQFNRYWEPQLNESLRSITHSDILYELKSIISNSVSQHLRSDVPVTIALSGGLDSSIVTSVASLVQRNVTTLTFSSSDNAVNELNWAQLVAEEAGCQSRIVKSPELTADLLRELVIAQGEPIAGPSCLAQFVIYREMKREGFKVILDGQGADELFAGYDGYVEYCLLTLLGSGKLLSAFKFFIDPRDDLVISM